MYIDNIYVNYAAPDNNINAPQNQQVKSTGEECSGFMEILNDTICETKPPYQINPETPAEKVNETEVNSVNNTYPMDSVPPVIKTQESAASSYVSQYYPIPEDEVIQALSNVRHIINNANMSEKSDAEKYSFIENKFIDAFGNDFLIARNLSLPSTMFYLIGIEFSDTLNRHIENPEQVNRERLYGDKSSDAVQDTIRSKYPSDLTNRDMFLMVNEMRNSGVLDSASLRTIGTNSVKSLVDTLSMLRNYSRFLTRSSEGKLTPLSVQDRDNQLMSQFNKLLHIRDLLEIHNIFKESGRVDIGEDVAPLFVKHLGGVLDDNGYFILSPGDGGYVDLTQLLDTLMNEMNEYDSFIRDRMKLIDDTEPTVALVNPEAEDQPLTDEVSGTEESPRTEESSGAEEFSGAGAEENTEANDEAA